MQAFASDSRIDSAELQQISTLHTLCGPQALHEYLGVPHIPHDLGDDPQDCLLMIGYVIHSKLQVLPALMYKLRRLMPYLCERCV